MKSISALKNRLYNLTTKRGKTKPPIDKIKKKNRVKNKIPSLHRRKNRK